MFAAGPRWLSSLYPSTVIEALVLPVVSTSHPLSGVPAACVLLVFLNSGGKDFQLLSVLTSEEDRFIEMFSFCDLGPYAPTTLNAKGTSVKPKYCSLSFTSFLLLFEHPFVLAKLGLK